MITFSKRTDRCQKGEPWKGLLSSLIAGAAASWIMESTQSLMSNLTSSTERPQEHERDEPEAREEKSATVIIADKIAHVAIGRDLTKGEEQAAGRMVHYGYGTLLGGIYGSLADLFPVIRAGRGAGYGAAVWLVGDELGLWALGLAKRPTNYPPSTHAYALTSHLIYGLSLEGVRRLVHGVI